MKAKLHKVWKIFVTGLVIIFIVVITIWSAVSLYNMRDNIFQLEKRVEYLERRYEEFKKPVNSAIDKWDKLQTMGGNDECSLIRSCRERA